MRSIRCLITLLALITPLFAADKPLPPDPAAHTVLIPFDETKPISGLKPERYFLDRADFDKLWALAKENRKPEKIEDKDDAKPEAILHSALYRATIEDERLAIEARFEVTTRGRWAKTRLVLADETNASRLPLHDLMVDGKPGAIKDGEVAFETAGHHTVQATFELVRSRNWKQASLQLPAARAAMLSLTLAKDDALPAFSDAKMVAVDDSVNGAHVITLGLGSASSLKFDRVQKRPVSEALPPSAEVTTTTSLTGEMRFHGVVKAHFVFPGSARKQVAVTIDPEWTLDAAPVVSSGTHPVRDLRVSMLQEAGKQVLTTSFPHEVSDEVTLDFHLTPKALNVSHTPSVAPKATRWESTAQLLAQDGVKLIPKPTDAQRRLANGDYSYKVDKLTFNLPLLRFRLGGDDTLAFDGKPADAKTEARIDYVYQISEQKLELAAAITLKRERGAWRQLRIGMPAGMEIQSVQGTELIAWEVQANDLFLRFHDQTGNDAKVIVYVANTVLKAAKNWTLEPLKLEGIQTTKGSAIIAAHAASEAKLEGFKRDHDLRETDPANLTNVFTITSPLEKKLAIEFERADWKLNVALQDLPTRFSADAILLTQATDVGVLVSQQLGVIVEQGALKRLVVRLPKGLPEATVTGDQLREVQSHVKGELREYECTFQSQGGLLGRSAVTFDMQLPLTDAELAIPFVEVADAERLRRWFVLDNASNRETKTLKADGVDLCARDALPYVPQVTTQPQFYQGRATGGLKVAFTQLQATSGNAAIITLADITTVLRTDGERWDTVIYSLSNRALQFLPVVLPDKAELMAVSVSGEPVRADEETRKGKRVRLIPLIQTHAGERSMEVRMVYRIKGSAVPQQVKLDDPDLVGLSAERTVWTASLPKGWTVADANRDTFGNMEPIAEEGREIEKLQSWMSDLGRINRAVSSSKDADFNAKAIKEAEKLNKQIEEVTSKVESKSKNRYSYSDEGKDAKPSARYQSKVDGDISKVKEELGRQVVVLTENRIAQPVFSNQAKEAKSSSGGRAIVGNGWALNGRADKDDAPATKDKAMSKLNQRYAEYKGLVQEATKQSQATQGKLQVGDDIQSDLAGNLAKIQQLEKEIRATSNNSTAALGLNDNVAVNTDFFGSRVRLNQPGLVQLSSSNTYSGGTAINAGTLTVNGTAGTSLTKSGAGTLTLKGDNSFTGAATINQGSLQVISSSGAFGGVVSGAGNFALGNSSALADPSNVQLSSNQASSNYVASNQVSSNQSTLNYVGQSVADNRNAFGLASNARAFNSATSNFNNNGAVTLNGGVVNMLGNNSTALNIANGGFIGGTPATPGLRFGQAAIVPDSIDGMLAPQKATPADPFGAPPTPAAPTVDLQLQGGKEVFKPGAVAVRGAQGSGILGGWASVNGADMSATTKTQAKALPAPMMREKAEVTSDEVSNALPSLTSTRAVNQLRPTGRRSLQVEVPLTGETWHFRKLKDHAVLDLQLRKEATVDKSSQATAFGLGLGAWGVLAFFSTRRRKKAEKNAHCPA